ncbi:MAG: hypothetical protein DRQ56_02955 [Gammaproteobacteria bacterium]|nr:MAG: hypothetical protein DRQ56_02955 [Gammaproteobacteria bacterium]
MVLHLNLQLFWSPTAKDSVKAARQMNLNIPSFRSAIAEQIASLALLFCLLFFSAHTAAEIPLFSAEYRLARGAIPIATVNLSLQRHDEGFLFESKTEPVAPLSWIREDLVIEQSVWHYHNQLPRPTHYRYKRSNRNSLHEVEVRFDWDKQTLHTTTNGNSWKMALAEKTLDKAVVQLALMESLSKGTMQNSYSVADGGRPKNYRFSATGNELLNSELGTVKTIRINRSKAGKQSDTTLWLAPRLNYLPIRIDKTRNGAVYSMTITRLSMPQ